MADFKKSPPEANEKGSSGAPSIHNDGIIPSVVADDPTENQYYAQFEANGPEWRADFEKKLLRKVDLRLLPLLIIMYINNFMDRSALGQARLGTLEEDLGMDPQSTQFNTAISILFVGYLTMQLPSNLLLSRLRPSIYLGSVMIVWGVVCAATAGVNSYGGLLAVRVFLGITEAPFFPGAIFLMSSWYTRTELTKRIAWFYSGVAVANGFSGLISAGILANLEGAAGIPGWRWIFIINGCLTIFFAAATTFVIPDYPKSTKWLTAEQRAYAAYRLKMDAEEEDDQNATGLMQGLVYCLKDWRVYVFALMLHSNILCGTFQYIFPSIVQTLGYGRIETLFLTVPVWFVAWGIACATTWSADRTGDRSYHIIAAQLVSMVGNILVAASSNTGVRFFGMFLMPIGTVSAFPIMTAWIANSFIRPLVKRASAIAICNAFANTASAYGSFMYPAVHEPQYLPGSLGNAGVCVVAALLALFLRIVHKRENKKLERAEAEGVVDPAGIANGDTRGLGFRYVY